MKAAVYRATASGCGASRLTEVAAAHEAVEGHAVGKVLVTP